MPSQPHLTPAQTALLAEIDAAPITMSIADLTETPRGHDLQTLGQFGLVRLGRGVGEDEAVRFSYTRSTDRPLSAQRRPTRAVEPGPAGRG